MIREPFLAFETAKYQLGPAVDVAAELDGRIDLLKMDPFTFEQLARELLLAMSGRDGRVTRRSRDDGIDGVVFDCSATMGCEFIVQAKRYATSSRPMTCVRWPASCTTSERITRSS